jgi:xanthine dehydrogenase iron-sulfur cluster and FAD-binding subunit A
MFFKTPHKPSQITRKNVKNFKKIKNKKRRENTHSMVVVGIKIGLDGERVERVTASYHSSWLALRNKKQKFPYA